MKFKEYILKEDMKSGVGYYPYTAGLSPKDIYKVSKKKKGKNPK